MQNERSSTATVLASVLALGALVAGCAGAAPPAAPAKGAPRHDASSTTRLTSFELGPAPRVGKVQRSDAPARADAGAGTVEHLGDEPKRSERDLDGRRTGTFGGWK